jgi:hypothetical protein
VVVLGCHPGELHLVASLHIERTDQLGLEVVFIKGLEPSLHLDCFVLDDHAVLDVGLVCHGSHCLSQPLHARLHDVLVLRMSLGPVRPPGLLLLWRKR